MGKKGMKYLIFDLECCDGLHICEFGYVIFDSNFNVVERNCITINPERAIKLSGKNGVAEIQLAFDERVYKNSPTFGQVYDEIKRVIKTDDCQIIGFAFENDCNFLAEAYENYNKEPIDFSYIDFQILYQAYNNLENRPSVAKVVEDLQIEDIVLHKSDDDSYAVMLALKKICQKEELDIEQTIKLLKKKKGNYFSERARLHKITLQEKVLKGNLNVQKEYIRNFLRQLEGKKITPNNFFNKKRVCFTIAFQRWRFNEFLALVEKLYEAGAIYTSNSKTCNIFIDCLTDVDDRRLAVAKLAIKEENKKMLIITIDQLMEKLGVTEQEILKKEYVKAGKIRENKSKNYVDKNSAFTLGDILKSKGINL